MNKSDNSLIPFDFLQREINRIDNEVKANNRISYLDCFFLDSMYLCLRAFRKTLESIKEKEEK